MSADLPGLGPSEWVKFGPRTDVRRESVARGLDIPYVRKYSVFTSRRTFMPTRTSRSRFPALTTFLICISWCLTGIWLFPQNAAIHLQPLSREIIAQRLQRLHLQNAERETELKSMFEEAGCEADRIQEQIVRRKDPPNIICTLPGATDSLIIVGAHFDHAEEGSGAVDDWSGASLLPSLYETLKDTPPEHTILFVGFTDEEKGLVGSDFYVKHFPKDQLSNMKAMVNLECLGLAPTEVWAHFANPELLADLVRVTRALHVELRAVNVEQVGNDDTQAFRDKKIPVITIHSISQETWPILHSKKDNLNAIHLDDLYESYKVVATYLSYIDHVSH